MVDHPLTHFVGKINKGSIIGGDVGVENFRRNDGRRGVTTAKLYDTQENAYLDLTSGRVDALLADKYANYDWLKSPAGQAYEFKGEPVNEDDKVGIALRKGDNELRAKLNLALKQIVEDGTYKKINDKYFPFSIY
mgnify:CR=1 FL=1